GKSIKVGELTTGEYEILNSPLVTLAGIEVPRALKGKDVEDEEEGEGEEGAEGAEAPAAEGASES
ncbi:MAG: 50S ribosomal protein L25, partial [Ekhidna sp.]